MAVITEEEIQASLDTFIYAWNRGDIETACEAYADHASFISASGGYTYGKEEILKRYRSAYPDRALMGKLELTIIEFRPFTYSLQTAYASAILSWSITAANGEKKSGFCLETYHRMSDSDRPLVVQDATV